MGFSDAIRLLDVMAGCGESWYLYACLLFEGNCIFRCLELLSKNDLRVYVLNYS